MHSGLAYLACWPVLDRSHWNKIGEMGQKNYYFECRNPTLPDVELVTIPKPVEPLGMLEVKAP